MYRIYTYDPNGIQSAGSKIALTALEIRPARCHVYEVNDAPPRAMGGIIITLFGTGKRIFVVFSDPDRLIHSAVEKGYLDITAMAYYFSGFSEVE